MKTWLYAATFVFFVLATPFMAAADSTTDAIAVLKAVKPAAAGSAEARAAVDILAKQGGSALIPLLHGFRDASPLAMNWLRTAFERAAETQIAADGKLPEKDLLEFIHDTQQSPVARRMAYEWLLRQRPELERELIPELLLDPAPEFRRDAVKLLMEDAAATTDKAASSELYQRAMQGAVHEDQVTAVAAALKERGTTVDIRRHLGFLATWKVIGPFDNKDQKGYAVAYPPEEQIDLEKEYTGQLGPVKWQPIGTEDEFGKLDIAKQIQNYKGSLMYFTTAFVSPSDQSLELRLGTPNAWKLWVNGKLVFEREEYHRSSQMDQYRLPVTLKKGENTILLKVCQNEQTQDWAQEYQFQLRVCDPTGAGVLSAASASAARSLNGAN